MYNFDTILNDSQNKFIRHDPRMLQGIFGADDVAPFWVADMEFPVAEPIAKELKRLADRAMFAYEFDARFVFRAIAGWNKRRHNLDLDSKSFVQVPGVLTGIGLLIRELTQPGDGVLIQTPVYHQFAKVIKGANRRIVRNRLLVRNGRYEMDFDDLENKLQAGDAKAILLCNPHNPVGRVWTQGEMQQLVELADKYAVTIISDEIHSDIVYPGHPFNSIISVAPNKHAALLGSPAKTFGMPSISNGYIYTADEAILEPIKKVVDSMYLSHSNAFTTFATIAAFNYGDAWLDELLIYVAKNVAWIENFLQTELPQVKSSPVEGTYQIWLDFSGTGLSKEELDERIFRRAKVGLTPGNWFDRESGLFMRMSIACPLSKVQAAFEQLKQAFVE
ncbi:MAG: PatB family C-S lyase [Chloroflexota bacterium]